MDRFLKYSLIHLPDQALEEIEDHAVLDTEDMEDTFRSETGSTERKYMLGPKSASSILVRLIHGGRCVILEEIHRLESEEERISILQLCDIKGQSAIPCLWNLRRLAKKAEENLGTVPVHFLDDDYSSLVIRGNMVSIETLAKAVSAMHNHAANILYRRLLFGLRFSDIKLEKIKDNIDQDGAYSMLDDSRNIVWKNAEAKLMNSLYRNDRLRRSFFLDRPDDSGNRFNEQNSKNWLNDCKEFIRILMVIIHLVSGKQISFTCFSSEIIQVCLPEQRN